MIFTPVVIGITFLGGSIIGLIIGNQFTLKNMRKKQLKEFKYWIGSFDDEGTESDFGITKTTPHGTRKNVPIVSNLPNSSQKKLHRGFHTVPIKRSKRSRR